ncbi:MAG: TolC family protein [Desulfobacterales bacterium]|nr:TolC family protein [Desulfobacterales bacterium]
MKTLFNFSLISIIFLSLNACSVHTIDYQPKPVVKAGALFSETADKQRVSERPWWLGFNRPLLNELIADSLNANQTILQARARLRQARAVTEQTRSSLFPQVTVEGDAGKTWQGTDPRRGTANIGSALQWELDIFNRTGALAEADRLDAQARLEDMNALRLTLSAEVANAYFGAVAAQRRLILLEDQVRTDQELLDLLTLRLENGVGTNVEVLQQQSLVAESRSLIPSTKGLLRIFENRLDVLLGQMPDGQNRIYADETLDLADIMPAVGVPADLLVNRPDLRAVKSELIAADAEIAAAIADRLPRFNLGGSFSYTDTAAYSGPVTMILGNFIQPLIDWGQRKAKIEENRAVYEERLALFAQLYLEAVEAVENALTREHRQREFIKRLEERSVLLKKTKDEAEALYTQGVDDYLSVLNALQELNDVERDLIDERLILINTRIALHRAVGGAITERSETEKAN